MEVILIILWVLFEGIFALIGWVFSSIANLICGIFTVAFEILANTVWFFLELLDDMQVWIMDEDQEVRNRRITNVVGVVALIGFLIAVGVNQVMHWSAQRKKQAETVQHLGWVSDGFARNNPNEISRWANGGYQDAWGHELLLVRSDREVVQFMSYGPDGEPSDDDIYGEVTPCESPYSSRIKPAAVSVDEPQRRGWHFKFDWSWGKKRGEG